MSTAPLHGQGCVASTYAPSGGTRGPGGLDMDTLARAAAQGCPVVNANVTASPNVGPEEEAMFSAPTGRSDDPSNGARVSYLVSLWPRRLEKPAFVLLDHRTKRVTPLGLARSIHLLVFVDDARHHVVLIEHPDHAL